MSEIKNIEKIVVNVSEVEKGSGSSAEDVLARDRSWTSSALLILFYTSIFLTCFIAIDKFAQIETGKSLVVESENRPYRPLSEMLRFIDELAIADAQAQVDKDIDELFPDCDYENELTDKEVEEIFNEIELSDSELSDEELMGMLVNIEMKDDEELDEEQMDSIIDGVMDIYDTILSNLQVNKMKRFDLEFYPELEKRNGRLEIPYK